jgi:hypothetical protein
MLYKRNPNWHIQPRAPRGLPEGGQWIDEAISAAAWQFVTPAITALARSIQVARSAYRSVLRRSPINVVTAPIPPRLPTGEYLGDPSPRRPDVPYLEFDHYLQLRIVLGSAGAGYNWHHVVEQQTVRTQQFPSRSVQNTDNIVRVTKKEHWCINRYYESKSDQVGEREKLHGKPWSEHYRVGLDILRRCRRGRAR